MSHLWLQENKWAVVGASTKEDRYGYKIYKKLKEHGYRVYPVSPKHDTIEGDPVFASIMDIPDDIDVVDFVVNPSIGIKVLEACGAKGIKKVILQPGTESPMIHQRARELEIEAIEACVLVMLSWK